MAGWYRISGYDLFVNRCLPEERSVCYIDTPNYYALRPKIESLQKRIYVLHEKNALVETR